MSITHNDALERFFGAKVLVKNVFQGKLEGKKCLDIGCGIGNLVLALAQEGTKEVIGVDVNLKDFGENYFLELANELGIDIKKTKLVEGMLEDINYDESSFDIITSFDVIEHVQNPPELIKEMFRILKPSGLCLIDTSPLYYSQIGSHLWVYYPRETMPWAPLYKDFDKTNSKLKVDDWSWQHFNELNKLTHLQLDSYIKNAGFKIVKYFTKHTGKEDYPKFKERIDHDLIPSVDDLFIEWDQYILTK